MDFSEEFKNILRAVAPGLATALGGPLAGVAVAALSQAILGKPNGTLEEIHEGYQLAGDPLKLQQAQSIFVIKQNELYVQMYESDAQDRASAREREIKLQDKTPRELSLMMVVGFFIVITSMILLSLFDTYTNKDVLNILYFMTGQLSGGMLNVLTYYFGSSSTSKDKDNTIKNLTGAK